MRLTVNLRACLAVATEDNERFDVERYCADTRRWTRPIRSGLVASFDSLTFVGERHSTGGCVTRRGPYRLDCLAVLGTRQQLALGAGPRNRQVVARVGIVRV